MRIFAFIYALIFLAIGISGFIPGAVAEGLLIHVFQVNAWLNGLHIATGVYALIVAFWNEKAQRNFFRIIGVLYAAMALMGFIFENREMYRFFASNGPDTWFHVIVSIAALVLGYGSKN